MYLRSSTSLVFTLALSILSLPPWRNALAADDPKILIAHGQWRSLRAMAQARVKSNPGDAEAQCLLSRALMAFGDLDRAEKAGQESVRLDSKIAAYHTQYADVLGSQIPHAGLFSKPGIAKHMRAECEAALAIDPRQWDAREALMQFYLQAPGIVGGDKKKAAALVEKAEKLDALHGHLLRAAYASSNKDSVAVERELRAAAATPPGEYEARIELASWMVSKRRWTEAEPEVRSLMALDPQRPGPHQLLTLICASQHRLADVDAALALTETDAPGHFGAHYQAARVFIVDNFELPRAERWLRAYLASEPEAGQPDLAHAHWRLGQALALQGKKPDARAEFEAALKLDPKLDEAKKELKKL